jgi:nucleoside-diphosphate-sugar epimerase
MRGKRMLKRVIVFGAHSYIGFGLCERLLSEGVEVIGILLKPEKLINKKLLEERLMLIGRNALFQTTECYERKEEEDTVDMIIYCCDDGVESSLIEQDRMNVVKSVKLAKELTVPYLFISSRNNTDKGLREKHINFCHDYIKEKINFCAFFQLPILFGPFQPPTETIHQFLVNYINDQKEILIVDEPLLYIQDAIDGIWELLGEFEQGKTYSFLSNVKKEKETSFSLELQMNVGNDQDDRIEAYFIKNPTTLEKGLKAQAEFIEKYRTILNT